MGDAALGVSGAPRTCRAPQWRQRLEPSYCVFLTTPRSESDMTPTISVLVFDSHKFGETTNTFWNIFFYGVDEEHNAAFAAFFVAAALGKPDFDIDKMGECLRAVSPAIDGECPDCARARLRELAAGIAKDLKANVLFTLAEFSMGQVALGVNYRPFGLVDPAFRRKRVPPLPSQILMLVFLCVFYRTRGHIASAPSPARLAGAAARTRESEPPRLRRPFQFERLRRETTPTT